MDFIDQLRSSRTSKTAILHKFLTQYDPNAKRIYLFVEGDADQSFYRSRLSQYLVNDLVPFFYNCEGKGRVFAAYNDVLGRYPNIANALFFVDKDVDDILGKQWPSDPRIFTTDLYSIENYVVARVCFERYLAEHVKIKRVELDLEVLLTQFDNELVRFHRFALPIMSWIVAMRRQGEPVVLNDVNFGKLFRFKDGELRRRSKRATIAYLKNVTQCDRHCDWRILRQVTQELSRMPPKQYVRGKFEAWWFVNFVNHVCETAANVAAETGGNVAKLSQLSISTFIQLLSESAIPPASLDIFASFHLGSLSGDSAAQPKRADGPIVNGIRKLLGLRT